MGVAIKLEGVRHLLYLNLNLLINFQTSTKKIHNYTVIIILAKQQQNKTDGDRTVFLGR